MDDPALEPLLHAQALRGLARLNRFSRSASILWAPIGQLASEAGKTPLRLLDLATGAGDLPVELWRRTRPFDSRHGLPSILLGTGWPWARSGFRPIPRPPASGSWPSDPERTRGTGVNRGATPPGRGGAPRAGLSLTVAGCDRSPVAIEQARARARRAAAPIEFFVADALTDPLPSGYDILTCSLFLHHLSDDDAVTLLQRMAHAAQHLVLVNDLVRGVPGLALAVVGTRFLSRSPVVHADGPQSVRAAYTIEEVCALASRAGLAGASVERRWPCRFLLSWRKVSDTFSSVG